jgi:hypothetical protein
MTLASHPIKNIRYSQFFYYKFSGIAVVLLVSAVKNKHFLPKKQILLCQKQRANCWRHDTATFALVYFASGRAFLFSSICKRDAFVMVNK